MALRDPCWRNSRDVTRFGRHWLLLPTLVLSNNSWHLDSAARKFLDRILHNKHNRLRFCPKSCMPLWRSICYITYKQISSRISEVLVHLLLLWETVALSL